MEGLSNTKNKIKQQTHAVHPGKTGKWKTKRNETRQNETNIRSSDHTTVEEPLRIIHLSQPPPRPVKSVIFQTSRVHGTSSLKSGIDTPVYVYSFRSRKICGVPYLSAKIFHGLASGGRHPRLGLNLLPKH